MGGNRRDSEDERRRRLRAEAQQARSRMLTALVRDYGDVSRRLGEAYRGVVGNIGDLINERLVLDIPDGATIDELMVYLEPIQSQLAVLDGALSSAGRQLSDNGVVAGLRAGVRNLQAGGVGVEFGVVNPQAVIAQIGLVDSEAWRAMVGRYAPYHIERVANLIITAQAGGRNPREVANIARAYFTGDNPLRDALRIARQSQIYSARVGMQTVYRDTDVEYWMWSANIGNARTCLACTVQHGRVYPTTQTLNDHFNGRCAPVPMTRSWRSLGFADGNDIEAELGNLWLLSQDEDTQRHYMGNELYEAWRMGRVQNIDAQTVVGIYEHPVWGEMRVRKSNAEILRR